jgi:Na+-translocating ferredoxin:NAD+ oxidoreductase RnfC subunit
MTLSQQLRRMGVVGAGGAGFPTEVKAQSTVDYLLANGAECEPLLHKDYELMKSFPAEIVSGMKRMQQAIQAPEARFCIKEKNKAAVDAVTPHAAQAGIPLTFLGDFYPSGDEYEIVYAATGRLIPAAGIPLNVGCVVNNVETLYNVDLAANDQPVTKKFVSIAGCVRKPSSFWCPIGSTFQDLIDHCGGFTTDDPAIFVSGLMMGSLTFDARDVVTKTTCGLIILPRDHYLVTRRDRPAEAMAHIGKSACDQCSYCTEFCPRYLLGYDVQPHKVMRSLGFTLAGKDMWNQSAELCCSCGLCTLYACPEDLYPKEACDTAKHDLRAAGIKFTQTKPVRVHPMKEYRRVPQSQLRQRLQVERYEGPTPFTKKEPEPASVRIKLKQHAGAPASAAVREGDPVKAGQVVGQIAEGKLGANVHASIAGTVRAVNETYVEIAR